MLINEKEEKKKAANRKLLIIIFVCSLINSIGYYLIWRGWGNVQYKHQEYDHKRIRDKKS